LLPPFLSFSLFFVFSFLGSSFLFSFFTVLSFCLSIKPINASSSVVSDFFSSKIVIPFSANILNISFLRSSSPFASILYRFVPSESFLSSFIDFTFFIPFVTFSILFSGSSTLSKFSGVSTARRFPLFIIITFSHIWLTSDNICELKIIVWSFPSDFIRFLICMTCFGSSPTVGSSSIKTLGFPTKAPAKLTRCLYPLDRFLISLFCTSSI